MNSRMSQTIRDDRKCDRNEKGEGKKTTEKYKQQRIKLVTITYTRNATFTFSHSVHWFVGCGMLLLLHIIATFFFWYFLRCSGCCYCVRFKQNITIFSSSFRFARFSISFLLSLRLRSVSFDVSSVEWNLAHVIRTVPTTLISNK